MTGKTVAVGIGFLAIPLIARLFSPDDYGVAALFISIVMIGTIVAALGYEQAIVLPKTDTQAASLVMLASYVAAALGLCLLLVNLLSLLLLGRNAFGERLGFWAWLIPVGALLWVSTKILDSWLLRHKDFKMMATAEITQAVVSPSTRLAFGALSGSSVWGLILGYLFGLAVRIVLQLKTAGASLKQAIGRGAQESTLKQTAVEYRDFPIFNAPAGLVRSLAQELPVLLLGVIFAPEIVGYYAMASRLVRAPMNLLAISVRRVLTQKFAEIHNEKHSLWRALIKTTLGMTLLGILPTLLLVTVGEPIVTVLLGASWEKAGAFVEILAPWLLSTWITVPSAVTLVVLRKQHVWLRVQISVVVLQLVVFLTAYYQAAEPGITLAAYVAVIVITNLGVMFYAWRHVWSGRQHGGTR